MKIFGIILIVLGLLLTIYTGIDFKKEEPVVELGNIEVTREKEKEVNWSPWMGAAAMVAGGILVFAGSKKPTKDKS
jgi:hypothetical protein